MSILHLVNRASALAACLTAAADDDAILLLEDGVYAAIEGLAPPRRLQALRPDVAARGLGDRLAAQVELASDEDFVRLVESHQPIVTWRS
jgi:tRNA 2-thiouridine synthesizing protein B